MAGSDMRRRHLNGSSLIEVLTVIVVFLVGILAVVQIFPPGLSVLRVNRAQTQAISLARSEVQRILGQSAQLPAYVASAEFVGPGAVVLVANDDPNQLVPTVDVGAGEGNIDANGFFPTGPVGHWSKVSGANRFNRVIGEGRPIAQPNLFNGQLGSPMQLMFAPLLVQRDVTTGVAVGQYLQVYGNDLKFQTGSADQGAPSSDPLQLDYDAYAFTYVPGTRATLAGSTVPAFLNQDQVWVGRLRTNVGGLLSHTLRIQGSFIVNDGLNRRPLNLVFTVPAAASAFYGEIGNYSVVSMPALFNSLGLAGFTYEGVEPASVRVQRQFAEIPVGASFSAFDPYQFKSFNGALGLLLLNPAGASARITDEDGNQIPLVARADYSVYDWRVIRDEFEIPRAVAGAGNFNPSMKLLLNAIRPSSGVGADARPYGGIALQGDTFQYTPNINGTTASQDFVLVDVQTGGVIAGNTGTDPLSAYVVDKSNGVIRFIDTDTTDAFAITGRILVPGATPLAAWVPTPTPVDLAGRKVRALYMGAGEYAVRLTKAASDYSVAYPPTAADLAPLQCYVGGSAGWGSTNRLYFALSDVNQKVTIGEAWVGGIGAPVLRDRDYRISGVETIGGISVAYAQLPAGSNFDFARNGYAVRRVKGASIRVRSYFNPETFTLGSDSARNFTRFQDWAENWRTTDTETYDAGANN